MKGARAAGLVGLLVLAACGPAAAPAAPDDRPGEVAVLPLPDFEPDAERGATVYAIHCASCHGVTGQGDGPAAAALDPHPTRQTDGARMNALSNAYLFRVIQEGGPAVELSDGMTPFGDALSAEQIWDVIAYLRQMARPPYEGTVP